MNEDRGFDMLAVEVFTWSPHSETACEVCMLEAERGRRVGFVFLDVQNVDEYPGATVFARWIYSLLRRTRQTKLRMIEEVLQSRGVTVIPPLRATGTVRISSQSAGIHSALDLRKYQHQGAALGLGALSSLITHLGDSNPVVPSYRDLVDRLLSAGRDSFVLTQQVIDAYRPRELLVFNGRHACPKGIVEAARLAGVKVFYHEVASTPSRYYCSENPIQSSSHGRAMLREAWEQAGSEREEIAAKYFAPRRGGELLLEARFHNPQKRGLSLSDTGRRRIAYYASSIDEYAAVEDGLDQGLFATQRDAVEWLVAWVRARPDHELIIRIHPRMRSLTPQERRWWMSQACENVTVLPAEHPADSYALSDSAYRVICFHSSIGPESSYRGKVSILVGDAAYRGLDCVYEPQSVEELDRMLVDTGLGPKPPGNSLPFGYRQMTQGTPFRFYQPTSFREGSIFGKPVPTTSPLLVRVVCKCLSLLDSGVGYVRRSIDEWRHR